MQGKRLANSLVEWADFVVVAELAAGPGFNFGPIEKFLKAAQEAGQDSIPQGFDFVGVTAPQSPGGAANLEPGDVLTRARASGLLGNLDFIPHVSCKDHNGDAIAASLMSYRAQGVESVLALTGDKPIRSKGVFEVESVGLLQLIRRMNNAVYLKAGPGQWAGVPQFFAGAAVSPFKYSEASQMQQYFKMEKKVRCGARFLITQLGYDWRKSMELMRYLQENGIDIPVLGNVYLLTTTTPAPRLMHDGKLPGCFVSDELLAAVQKESIDDHVERAAQQVAMYRAVGAAGVDVGGLPDFNTLAKILQRAAEIGGDWERYKENLCWPPERSFYLYDEAGQRTASAVHRKQFQQRCFNLTHRLILDRNHGGFRLCRGLLALARADKGRGFVCRAFTTLEKAAKHAAFDCQDCGDCYLPENFGYCTIGGCEKGLSNAPCGDSTVDGLCGNNLDRVCIGESIYNAAAAWKGGRRALREAIHRPRKVELHHTSSILNYLFDRDHTRKAPLIVIGDLIDAGHPKTGKVMRELLDLGDEAFARQDGPIGHIRAMIQDQADEGADYIAVNVDAISDEKGRPAIQMMKRYVRLVHRWGGGVPVCVDSRFEEVLVVGLKEWYGTNPSARPPLLSAVACGKADKVLPLRKEHDFSLVLRLDDPVDHSSAQETLDHARQFLEEATVRYGFHAGQVFFDPAAAPLMKDVPARGDGGRTHCVFDMIRRIKAEPALRQSHCLLRVGDVAGGLPGRAVGVCRAYVAEAMEYGLDAILAGPANHFGEGPADPALLTLVRAYAAMDGSPERTREAQERMAAFCDGTQKPRRTSAPPALSKT